jgi:EAL domain-containing protein (putative c-di-GMP-specific phosphodiesterase class I)
MRVLLVDDSEVVRRAYGDSLAAAGFEVQLAVRAEDALRHAQESSYDVVLSDISMPGMDGIEFLKALRRLDLDVPVVLMTGGATLQTAVQAVEYGAFRYLTKPIPKNELEDVLRRAARYHALATLQRQALAAAGGAFEWPGDRAALESRFATALDRLFVAFQPIVEWGERRIRAHEVLVRSHEPSLSRPVDLLEAAQRLGRLRDLGRAVRAHAAAAARAMPDDVGLFINLHPDDLNDEALYDANPLAPLAGRVVLEVTEQASLDGVQRLTDRMIELRRMGFQVAVDDLGAGYAGLSSMAHIEPEYVKLDRSLTAGVHRHATKRKLVRSMTQLCAELGMHVIAEAVESELDRDALLSSGCELLQGYLFARPEAVPPAVNWGKPPVTRGARLPKGTSHS